MPETTPHLTLDALVALVREKNIPVVTHSDKVVPGSVFVCLPPALPAHKIADAPGSERFLPQVMEKAPFAVVLPHSAAAAAEQYASTAVRFVLCPSTRKALGQLASAFCGTDRHCPTVFAVTGTNGKTTETYLLEHVLRNKGQSVGIMGTVEYRWPGHHEESSLTTPGCLELHGYLGKMQNAGVDTVVMEVSSHAIDQERVAGIAFAAALITNLTQDHLDYHDGLDDYFDVKSRLFAPVAAGGLPLDGKGGACNADDPWCRKILERYPSYIGFGLVPENRVPGTRHLLGSLASMSPAGMRLTMNFEGEEWEIASPLVGGFNASNLLGAQALGLAMGLKPADFACLEGFYGVPGRLERIANTKGLSLFVDYAHTPDALVKAQQALRQAGFTRIITVFGCGGNRDNTKRPLMGKAVAEHADVAVLTSDNPRKEDPEAIMDMVMPGLAGCAKVHREVDRKKALALALTLLGPNDALLVAGKGHEPYQIIGDTKFPFSDQTILRELAG